MAKSLSARTTEDKRRLLDRYVRERVDARRSAEPVIRPRSPAAPAPLSFEQELIWIHSKLAPHLPLYNEILTIRRSGTLDVGVLERVLEEILRRHEAWRTTFDDVDGRIVQVVRSPPRVSLPLHDLSAHAREEREREALRIAKNEVLRPFDLREGPLVRATLLRMANDEYRLLLVAHQIVHDGVSVYSIFLPELTALYEAFAAGRASPLPELRIQYADYATWQREASLGTADASLEYWRRQLAGQEQKLDLPTDAARPTLQTFRGSHHTFRLPKGLSESVKRLSEREGATPFATLLSAFEVLLHRHSGQEDITIGTVVSTRRCTEVEPLLGAFVNSIALRTPLSGSWSFQEVLAKVRLALVDGLSHGDLPFHLLVRDLQPRRTPGHNPLFQVSFVFEPPIRASSSGWSVTQKDVSTGFERVDLCLQMEDRPEGFLGYFRYNTDLWRPDTVARLVERFELLLEGIVADPGRPIAAIPILTASDRRAHEGSPNEPSPTNQFAMFERGEIESSIPARFAAQVSRHGHRQAVRDAQRSFTYRELDEAANRVAHRLAAEGVVPNDRVALLLDHDASMLAGVLGVLKCGATYVPLDPTHPEERLRRIVVDADAKALVGSRRNLTMARQLVTSSVEILELEALLSSPIAPEYGSAAKPEHVAYLMYTSGSTGAPKGVAQSQRNVLHFMAAYTNRLHLAPEDRLLQLASYSVDAGVMDAFGALLNGALLHLVDVRDVGLKGVRDHLVLGEITVYHSTPTLFRHLVHDFSGRAAPSTVRLVVLGGEEARAEDVVAFRGIFGPRCILVSGFGLTESSVSLQYFVEPHAQMTKGSLPLGRPVERTTVTLLSTEGCPDQVYGEIGIRSPHVALGYWKDPERTRAAFLPDPAGGPCVLYKTGDMGRLLPDGNVAFCGRRDLQIKVQGFRVELGELESALGQHPNVKEAAAAAAEGPDGEKRLIAHVVPREHPGPSLDELRRFLRRRLPVYMIPSAVVQHDALPLTPTGKLDRRTLPVPVQTTVEPELAAPTDELERKLAEVWRRVLGVERVGLRDDFFDLGGHSLVALRLMADIHRELGVDLPLATLFDAPTVERLAEVVRAEVLALQRTSVVAIQRSGPSAPFFCILGRPGDVAPFRSLSRHLGHDQPFFAIAAGRRSSGADRTRVAAEALEHIISIQPQGPYLIGGYRGGARIALEVARALRDRDAAQIGLLALFWESPRSGGLARRTRRYLEQLHPLPLRERLTYLLEQFRPSRVPGPEYPGTMTVFLSGRTAPEGRLDPQRDLAGMSARHVQVVEVPGDERSMLEPPFVQTLALQLAKVLERATSGPPPASRERVDDDTVPDRLIANAR